MCIRDRPEHFQVELLTCNGKVDLLIEQALEFKPNAVVIGDASKLDAVKDALFPKAVSYTHLTLPTSDLV